MDCPRNPIFLTDTAEALGGSGENRQTDTIRVFAHLRIPKPNNRPPLAFKPSRAPRITCNVLGLRVLPTIKLYRKPCLPAGDINYKFARWQLPRKARTKGREYPPDNPFLRRRIIAQKPCSRGDLRVNAFHELKDYLRTIDIAIESSDARRRAHPPLTPPFQGGG